MYTVFADLVQGQGREQSSEVKVKEVVASSAEETSDEKDVNSEETKSEHLPATFREAIKLMEDIINAKEDPY